MGEVVEEDLQLLVIVKVSSDDCAHRGGHGELGRGDVLGREGCRSVDRGARGRLPPPLCVPVCTCLCVHACLCAKIKTHASTSSIIFPVRAPGYCV